MATEAQFQFDAEPWQKILKEIEKKWDKVTARKFGDIIAPTVFGDIMDHFSKEDGPDGRWKGWSATYAKHMETIGKGGNKILQDSGKLRMSFQPSDWKGQSDGILFVNKAHTKSGFPYAAAHDEGGPKLPQRRFMWLSPRGMNKMIGIVENWLADVGSE